MTSLNTKKKILSLSCLLIPFVAFFLASSRAENQTFLPFIESFPNGKIDWDSGYFYGVGIGYPHLNQGSKARALKVAQASALSAILQVASGIRVDDQRSLADLEREKLIIQIKALIIYESYEQQFIEEDEHPFWRVTYRAPMKGVKGLTKELYTRLRAHPPPRQELQGQEGTDETDASAPWLVLDARGLAKHAVQPAIFPKIVVEDGETVYDLNTVEEKAVVERGMARYVVSDKGPEELGFMSGQGPWLSFKDLFSPQVVRAEEKRKPRKRGRYIVKTVKQAQGLMRTNLVISESDAKSIREEDAASKILRECRVIVIVSSSLGGIEGGLMHSLHAFREQLIKYLEGQLISQNQE